MGKDKPLWGYGRDASCVQQSMLDRYIFDFEKIVMAGLASHTILCPAAKYFSLLTSVREQDKFMTLSGRAVKDLLDSSRAGGDLVHLAHPLLGR